MHAYCILHQMKQERPWQQRAIALTGGLGSGKSTVSKILQRLGANVICADELAKEAVAPGTKALENITAHFGRDILLPDGSLNRKKLGSIIFTDSPSRLLLEAIVHPEVKRLAAIKAARCPDDEPLFYDCPLFFENKMESLGFRDVWVVAAPRELCLKRVIRRDGLTAEEAQARWASQMPLEEKVKRAGKVIRNEGTLEELQQLVEKLYRNALTQHSASRPNRP